MKSLQFHPLLTPSLRALLLPLAATTSALGALTQVRKIGLYSSIFQLVNQFLPYSLDRSFFEKLGFTPLDFELISWFTSWAVTRKKNNPETCGILSPSERSKKEETNSTEEIQSFPWSALSETEKENFGFTCKALIDLGRVDFMVERGLIVSALEYVEADISPENKLILAKTP